MRDNTISISKILAGIVFVIFFGTGVVVAASDN
jgi:hypothetical protein